MRMMARFVLIAALAGFGVAAATPASAQSYPPSGCSLGTSTSVVNPGGQVTVTGSGFDAGPVTILFDGSQVAAATANAGGSFSVAFNIPSNAGPGTHTIQAVPADAKCDPSTTITIRSGAAAAAGGALAFTGSNSLPLAWVGLAALALGTIVLVGVRRRAAVSRAGRSVGD